MRDCASAVEYARSAFVAEERQRTLLVPKGAASSAKSLNERVACSPGGTTVKTPTPGGRFELADDVRVAMVGRAGEAGTAKRAQLIRNRDDGSTDAQGAGWESRSLPYRERVRVRSAGELAKRGRLGRPAMVIQLRSLKRTARSGWTAKAPNYAAALRVIRCAPLGTEESTLPVDEGEKCAVVRNHDEFGGSGTRAIAVPREKETSARCGHSETPGTAKYMILPEQRARSHRDGRLHRYALPTGRPPCG